MNFLFQNIILRMKFTIKTSPDFISIKGNRALANFAFYVVHDQVLLLGIEVCYLTRQAVTFNNLNWYLSSQTLHLTPYLKPDFCTQVWYLQRKLTNFGPNWGAQGFTCHFSPYWIATQPNSEIEHVVRPACVPSVSLQSTYKPFTSIGTFG